MTDPETEVAGSEFPWSGWFGRGFGPGRRVASPPFGCGERRLVVVTRRGTVGDDRVIGSAGRSWRPACHDLGCQARHHPPGSWDCGVGVRVGSLSA